MNLYVLDTDTLQLYQDGNPKVVSREITSVSSVFDCPRARRPAVRTWSRPCEQDSTPRRSLRSSAPAILVRLCRARFFAGDRPARSWTWIAGPPVRGLPAQIGDVEPSARSPHDQILFRQPAPAAPLVRGQRNPKQIETARKVEKGKQLVAGKIRFGKAMLERVLREGGPELGFFGGIILQFLLEAADPDKCLAAEAHGSVAGLRNLEGDDRLFFVGPFRLQFPTPCTPFRARAAPPSSTRPTDTRRSSPDRSCCASTRPIPFRAANREARPTEMRAGVGSFVAIIAICRYPALAGLAPPCDEILRVGAGSQDRFVGETVS